MLARHNQRLAYPSSCGYPHAPGSGTVVKSTRIDFNLWTTTEYTSGDSMVRPWWRTSGIFLRSLGIKPESRNEQGDEFAFSSLEIFVCDNQRGRSARVNLNSCSFISAFRPRKRTPSASSRRRCSMAESPRTLISPPAPNTRCHGNPNPRCRTRATSRAPLGSPAARATAP